MKRAAQGELLENSIMQRRTFTLKRRDFIVTTLGSAAALALSSRQQSWAMDPFFFRDGDRVVFLGDSITQQQLYTTYIESYLLTRFPKWQLWFRNAGWGGDTAWLRQRASGITDQMLLSAQGAEREQLVAKTVAHGLGRDVLPLKPTAITIDFGMNDARGRDRALPLYEMSLMELVKQLKAAGVRVALLTPSPEERNQADQPAGSEYNQWLRKYGTVVDSVSLRQRTAFVDQLQPFIDVIEKGRLADPNFKLIPDAVHPGPAGQLVMAWAILKGLNAPPDVSHLHVDATAKRVVAADGCRVNTFSVTTERIAYERADDALPMSLPKEAPTVLPFAPILDDLSRHTLRVTGLRANAYDVLIDGSKVATVPRADLERGWSMAAAETPMQKQANDVMAMVVQKNNLYFRRWRQVQLGNAPDKEAQMRDLDQQIANLEKQIDTARQPKLHRFELR